MLLFGQINLFSFSALKLLSFLYLYLFLRLLLKFLRRYRFFGENGFGFEVQANVILWCLLHIWFNSNLLGFIFFDGKKVALGRAVAATPVGLRLKVFYRRLSIVNIDVGKAAIWTVWICFKWGRWSWERSWRWESQFLRHLFVKSWGWGVVVR